MPSAPRSPAARALLVLVLAAASRAFGDNPVPPVALKFYGLFSELQTAQAQKAIGQYRHVEFHFTEQETNEYLRFTLKNTPRPGLDAVTISVQPHNYISTHVVLDLDAVERWRPGTIPTLLKPMLNGKKSLSVDVSFQCTGNGKATFSVEKAYYQDIRVPAFLVEEMIKIVAARQPEKYDTSKPIPLPFGLMQVWTGGRVISGRN